MLDGVDSLVPFDGVVNCGVQGLVQQAQHFIVTVLLNDSPDNVLIGHDAHRSYEYNDRDLAELWHGDEQLLVLGKLYAHNLRVRCNGGNGFDMDGVHESRCKLGVLFGVDHFLVVDHVFHRQDYLLIPFADEVTPWVIPAFRVGFPFLEIGGAVFAFDRDGNPANQYPLFFSNHVGRGLSRGNADFFLQLSHVGQQFPVVGQMLPPRHFRIQVFLVVLVGGWL